MYDFDPTRTIFVCNKWDQVPVAEEETVWNNTVKKLKDHWPNFSESQMFKLSTKEVCLLFQQYETSSSAMKKWSYKRDNTVIFYYLSASEICPLVGEALQW